MKKFLILDISFLWIFACTDSIGPKEIIEPDEIIKEASLGYVLIKSMAGNCAFVLNEAKCNLEKVKESRDRINGIMTSGLYRIRLIEELALNSAGDTLSEFNQRVNLDNFTKSLDSLNDSVLGTDLRLIIENKVGLYSPEISKGECIDLLHFNTLLVNQLISKVPNPNIFCDNQVDDVPKDNN
ncbi:MAG: hypothetical protein NXI09_15895 [Bacteroidetes bacterium]|nr:hypothetical protein [Bacteroidota bacterium]